MPKAGVEHRTDWLEHLDTISDTDSILSHENVGRRYEREIFIFARLKQFIIKFCSSLSTANVRGMKE